MLSNSESMDIEDIDNDKALLGFIVDYLRKRGFEETVTTLYDESPKTEIIPKSEISNLIGSVNEIRGNGQSGLIEWWGVFWEILKETKRGKKAGKPEIVVEATGPNPKRIRKKQPITIPTAAQPILDTLDLTSLTGIEKSLTSSGMMNKDLNKLTSLEAKRIEVALKSNKVSKEAWEIYLKLCKEYQRIPQNIQNQNTKIEPYITNTLLPYNANNPTSIPSVPSMYSTNSFSNTSLSKSSQISYNNYMGMIDQVNQPIDSKQLLMFRQSLYQEYLKKQQAAISIMTKDSGSVKDGDQRSTGTIGSVLSTSSIESTPIIGIGNISNVGYITLPNININSNNIAPSNLQSNQIISPPELTNNNFLESSEKEEFFYEFINEYLI